MLYNEGEMTTNKQKAFIAEYLKDFNATQAAIRAGYSKHTARSQGQRLLTNVDISNEIRAILAEKQMSADEALLLTANIARGDMADFMDESTLMLDLRKAKEMGKTRLIKKIKQRTVTKLGKNDNDDDVEIHDLEIELYPADAAQDKILRVTGQYKDVGSEDNPHIVYIKKIGVDLEKV